MSTQNHDEFQGNLVVTPWFYKQWLVAGNPAHFFDRIANDFGDFVRYRGLLSFYLINHPSLVKQVLKDTHRTFDKNSVIYNRFRNAFGDGLVVSEGDRWKRQRKRKINVCQRPIRRRPKDLHWCSFCDDGVARHRCGCLSKISFENRPIQPAPNGRPPDHDA